MNDNGLSLTSRRLVAPYAASKLTEVLEGQGVQELSFTLKALPFRPTAAVYADF